MVGIPFIHNVREGLGVACLTAFLTTSRDDDKDRDDKDRDIKEMSL
jgi:hypothetical protein